MSTQSNKSSQSHCHLGSFPQASTSATMLPASRCPSPCSPPRWPMCPSLSRTRWRIWRLKRRVRHAAVCLHRAHLTAAPAQAPTFLVVTMLNQQVNNSVLRRRTGPFFTARPDQFGLMHERHIACGVAHQQLSENTGADTVPALMHAAPALCLDRPVDQTPPLITTLRWG